MASPPHIPQLNMPRKRTSISSMSSLAKKRKPSALRNSFAPENESAGSPLTYERSPSVDSVATTSVVNGAGGKKRKRKDVDAMSATGSSVRGGKRLANGSIVNEAGDHEDEEDEADDLDEDVDTLFEGGRATEASKEQEQENERILLQAMTQSQQDRHALYRRVRLRPQVVRKLVNQTLSQSVPANVVLAVCSYSKAFIGELVDRALTVRDEWAAARTRMPNTNIPNQVLSRGLTDAFAYKEGAKPMSNHIRDSGLFYNQVDRNDTYFVDVPKETTLQDRLKESDKGPLTPDHLREALRRYKRDREGDGAGFAGLSLEGQERTLARTGGKRLFR
ncbi:histone-fold-containing protein [Massarina eburnea CBS 473.64]|uniref:Histone-fold-containing protein n=1 Tax=Massarina eburnea CBS 473.64 TaxID=1395130 RepID=A0A6A6RT99_9PLEO|nr:histone-fold-containing protein [Massarina eburnea CBS 473.64]